MRQEMIGEQSHKQGVRMESTGDEAAKGAGPRVRQIDVKGLRIEVPCEGDDLIIGHAHIAVFVDGPFVVVLKVAFLDWHGKISVAQCSGLGSTFRSGHGISFAPARPVLVITAR